jgi:hypothetical protein
MSIGYVAGCYNAYTDMDGVVHSIDENIAIAKKIAAELWTAGHTAICPHANTEHFEILCPTVPYQQYIDGDIEILKLCDFIEMIPNWKYSNGGKGEHAEAVRLGMPVYEYPEIPPLHPTEVNCPEQVKAFREILGRMMRTHLSKNSDYSPANILLTGQLGLATRLWDKTARLLNLTGFHVPIETTLTFTKPRAAKNESLNDTYMDLAVYAIIGKLLLEEKWGK